MFESITKSLEAVFDRLRGKGRLSRENIQEGLREVRTALLEADVNYKVVKDLIQRVTEKAVGEEVLQSVTPGQQVIKIIYDELIKLMGPVGQPLTFQEGNPTVIMLVGLHGCGKTTTAAKLAKLALSKGRKPLLVAADVQRPAAVEQLKVLGKQLGIPVYSENGGQPPLLCERAVEHAIKNGQNTIVLDTAGRLHIDEELMSELREIKERTKPHVILFVCDAMTGQDAVNSAKEFNAQLEFDGAILTKLDGDTRGGAALSVKAVTGKPIRYVGVGEKLEMLEEFYPDRMASRILGMGDVVTLVEKAQAAVKEEEAKAFARKIKDESLTLEDFLDQLQKVKKMGPLQELMGMIPGMGTKMEGMQVEEAQMKKIEAVMQSMNKAERKNPDIIDGSRRQRIATGSATTPHDVNQLLKQFRFMKKMLKQMSTTSPFRMGLPKGVPVGMLKGKRK
ncbi:MAG TPA: signal recognition particle protein [Candidatus Tripitaka californicus]|uniref:signal recognition particle protein n=1 Tax=Candidatus Tripitaka californicus TaxID=3367616 RepID=UPI00402821F3|nr:signal recognition particle protein [Planctomycetota bacterium]